MNAIKKRYYKWIFEQWQDRDVPIIQKPDIFGKSAREVGSYPLESDMRIESPFENGENSISFKSCSENGSWMILEFTKSDKNYAIVNLEWNHEVENRYFKTGTV